MTNPRNGLVNVLPMSRICSLHSLTRCQCFMLDKASKIAYNDLLSYYLFLVPNQNGPHFFRATRHLWVRCVRNVARGPWPSLQIWSGSWYWSLTRHQATDIWPPRFQKGRMCSWCESNQTKGIQCEKKTMAMEKKKALVTSPTAVA